MDVRSFGPRVGTAVFIVRNGKFIILKRQGSHGAGTWSTPGGHVEFGEDPVDTCKREALEETGCEIADVRFVAMTNDYFKADNKHYITLWYVARWTANEPQIIEPHKCTELAWTAFNDMPRPRLLTYDSLTSAQIRTLEQAIGEEQ